MDITNYLNQEYSDAALYINFRNTAGIDGLKNAARKVVYTIRKRNIKEPLKVSNLGSEVAKEAAYLHGEAGIQGTIVTIAKSYCGANNLPVLEGVGSFGTRFTPDSAAPRYIFAKPADYFNELFKPEDDINLKYQKFEGEEIEPIYYAPTLPLLLVNGSKGVGVGFASDILPRSVENIFKMIRAKLTGKKIKSDWLTPHWNGFRGTVSSGEGSWIVKGCLDLKGKKAIVTEVPISWTLAKYIKHLRKLKEKGLITSFADYSEDDRFKFEVKLTDEEAAKSEDLIYKDLGLIETMSENFVTINENNAVDEYDTARAIFEDYFKLKMQTLKARLKSEIARLSQEESVLSETYRFVKLVIDGKVDVRLKKAEVEKVLKSLKFTIIDKLLAMPIYSLTADKAAELKSKWQDKTKELEAMKKETPESLWTKDLDTLEAKLKKLGKL